MFRNLTNLLIHIEGNSTDHDILLKKLDFYRVRGVSGEFLRSYLSNRSQFVSLGNMRSHKKSIVCGVPQGSVLGPVLFNLYINDIVNVSNKFKYVLFADDTNILYSGEESETVENIVNKELHLIYVWLCTNKLSINLSKTNFMVFSKSKRPCIPRIHISNHQIELTDHVRFLGVFIDSRLTWKKHINYISTKLRTVSFLIYKASSILDCNCFKILYVSLFLPTF